MEMLWARRRLIFALALCILVTLLAVLVIAPLWHAAPPITTVSQATTTPAPTATWHPTYSIVFDGPFVPAARRGSQLAYRWSPQLDPAPRWPARAIITCTFALYGPFPTQADAEHARQTDLSTATPAVAAAPVTLDNWTSEPHPGTLTLPENLALGYYVIFARTVENYGLGESASIAVIRIVN